MWSGWDIFQFRPVRTSCQRVPSLPWCLCWSRTGWGWRRIKERIIFCGFFFINNILDLDAHYLKSAQQKRPAWAVRTFTFILSSLCLTVRKASLSLKWDGVLMRRGARDETFDGLLGSRLCRANLCPQAYEQWPSLNLEFLKHRDHTLNLLHMSRTTGVEAHAIQALHKVGTFDKNWCDCCKEKYSLSENL